MTSGLFNTGVAGDSSEITSNTAAAQPGPSMSDKFVGHDDFLGETFDTDFDMDMFGDLGSGFDPLGDESLDSFTDLSALLSEENMFLDQMKEEEPAPFPDFTDNVKATTTTSLKRSFEEMEAGTSDLDNLPAHVGLATLSNLDHDYSTKRPRLSTATEEPAVEEVFLAPAPVPSPTPTPTPSTSYIITVPPADKSRHRREKNNVASKRSREVRKQKFVNMEAEAEHLIAENARMEKRVVELERLAKKMKEILVAKMAGK